MATLISAFSSPELSHVSPHLAGLSPDKHPNLPPNIKALGRVSRDRMAELMSSAWCLVHMSLVDTGPTVVKEARVVGLPVILSTECGAQCYVNEGASGRIIPPHDEKVLIRHVLTITQKRETSLAMGSHGKGHCRRHLCIGSMKSRIQELYLSLLLEGN